MMKTYFPAIVAAALLGSAVFADEKQEHHMDMEKLVIDGLEQNIASEGKFNTYTHHLGQPAMHSDLSDGKYIRIHQTAVTLFHPSTRMPRSQALVQP